MQGHVIMDMEKERAYVGYVGEQPKGYHLIFRNSSDYDIIKIRYTKDAAEKFLTNFYKQFPKLNPKK